MKDKKYYFIILPLLFLGCSLDTSYFKSEDKNVNHETAEQQVETTLPLENKEIIAENDYSDDLLFFTLQFQSIYDLLLDKINQFYTDMNDQELSDRYSAEFNDVPFMRFLGKKGLNDLKISNLEVIINDLNNIEFNNHFSQTIREMQLSFEFLKKFYINIETLQSFEQFKLHMVDYQSCIELAHKIKETFIIEYDYLKANNKTIDYSKSDAIYALVKEVYKNEKSTVNNQEKITKKNAFITLADTSNITRSSNNAYYIYGTTSDNCSKILIIAENFQQGKKDEYYLKNYQYGHTSFKYGIREDWNNLYPGTNYYTFQAYCDDNQVKETNTSIIFSYPVNNQINQFRSSEDYNYKPSTSSYSYYSNESINDGYEWAELHDIDSFDDCQDQFGTGDDEDGCNEYVKSNHTGYNSFGSYECTEDCSGHQAGYDWAEKKDIDDISYCRGKSQSFIEGCYEYVDENY